MVDEDVFNGERGNFSKENAAESVCNAGVNANEGKDSVVRFVLVELDVEVLGGASAGTLCKWRAWTSAHCEMIRGSMSGLRRGSDRARPWR